MNTWQGKYAVEVWHQGTEDLQVNEVVAFA
jgi:hypothetical protein